MSPILTDYELRQGADLAEHAQHMWGWLLAGGIASVIFGFFVLSYTAPSIFALTFFAGAYFLATGVFEIVGAFRMLQHQWLYVVMGVISIGAGVAAIVWPAITIYVIAVLIGWVLLFWGITDIVSSLFNRYVPHWWLYLVRGLLELVLGVWALRHPGAALVILVVVIGFWAIIYGVAEIVAALRARHAVRNWEAYCSRLEH